MYSSMFWRLIPSRNYYPIVAVMVITTAIGALLTTIGEYAHINYASSLGCGLLASGLLSLILYVMQSKNERRHNLETLYFITQRFADKIGFAKPLCVGCKYNHKTLEFYESLFKDLDLFEEIWGRIWFSNCDWYYYHRTIYSTMGRYCKELRAFWDFRSATGAPDEVYIHDIIELQAYVFDKEGNNILKNTLTEACDRLLDQMGGLKL